MILVGILKRDKFTLEELILQNAIFFNVKSQAA